jgi:hypothetical protein
MRADKTGQGQPALLTRVCASSLFDFVATSGFVYLLCDTELWRVDRESGAHTTIQLQWSHNSGGIYADDAYVYTVMPGCAAITRFDKQTLAPEVMYIAGVSQPSIAGLTELTRIGDKLVCGSPGDLYAIDAWNTPARHINTGIPSLLALNAWQDSVYWMQRGDPEKYALGYVPIAGGAGNTIPSDIGWTNRFALAPTGKLATGNYKGIWVFDAKTNMPSKQILLNVDDHSFRVDDVTTDPSYVYATIYGFGVRNVDGGPPTGSIAYWIDRIPFADLE